MKFRVFFIPLTATLLMSSLLMSSPVLAQDAPLTGQMSAVSFRPVAKGSAVMIKLYDDSKGTMALKSAFKNALQAQGYKVQDNARLSLSFDVENNVQADANSAPGRLQFTGQSGGYTGGEEYTARLELFSTNQDTRGKATTAGFIRMDVSITDRKDGRRVWQGWADSNSSGQQPEDVSVRLVGPLVNTIGTTVRNRPLSTQ